MTSASSTPMTMIAIGMTCARSLLEIELMSYRAGASPATPESVACSVGTMVCASALTAGTALSAAVVDGSPAASDVSNWIVLPSADTNCVVARYSWGACARWVAVVPAWATAAGTGGAVAGSVPEPSSACSCVYSAGVKPVVPIGLSGPVTAVNTGSFCSCVVAAAIAAASSQAGVDSL